MGEGLYIAIQVLSDWRVIVIAVGTFLVWAILRRVGSVYRRPKMPVRRAGRRIPPVPGVPSKGARP